MPRLTNTHVSAKARRGKAGLQSPGVLWTGRSWVSCGSRWATAIVRSSAGRSFHHWATRTEKSWDLAECCLPVFSEGDTSLLVKQSLLNRALGLGRRVWLMFTFQRLMERMFVAQNDNSLLLYLDQGSATCGSGAACGSLAPLSWLPTALKK